MIENKMLLLDSMMNGSVSIIIRLFNIHLDDFDKPSNDVFMAFDTGQMKNRSSSHLPKVNEVVVLVVEKLSVLKITIFDRCPKEARSYLNPFN